MRYTIYTDTEPINDKYIAYVLITVMYKPNGRLRNQAQIAEVLNLPASYRTSDKITV